MNYSENISNTKNLNLRMTTPEVCQLARIGKGKLRKYIRAGKFPKPVDRGGKGYIWNTSTVLEALGINLSEQAEINPWEQGLQ